MNVAGEAIEALGAHRRARRPSGSLRGRLTRERSRFCAWPRSTRLNRRDVAIPWAELEPCSKSACCVASCSLRSDAPARRSARRRCSRHSRSSTCTWWVRRPRWRWSRLLGQRRRDCRGGGAALARALASARAHGCAACSRRAHDAEARRAAAELLAAGAGYRGAGGRRGHLAAGAPSAQIVEALRAWGAEPWSLCCSARCRASRVHKSVRWRWSWRPIWRCIDESAEPRRSARRSCAAALAPRPERPRYRGGRRGVALLSASGPTPRTPRRCSRTLCRAMRPWRAPQRVRSRRLAERAPDAVERALSRGEPRWRLTAPCCRRWWRRWAGRVRSSCCRVLNAVDDRDVRRAALHRPGQRRWRARGRVWWRWRWPTRTSMCRSSRPRCSVVFATSRGARRASFGLMQRDVLGVPSRALGRRARARADELAACGRCR